MKIKSLIIIAICFFTYGCASLITQSKQESCIIEKDNSKWNKVALKGHEPVFSAQSMLTALGHQCGHPDGQYGNNTARCIQKYQRNNRLNVDGNVSLSLLNDLANDFIQKKRNKEQADTRQAQQNDVVTGAGYGAAGGAAIGAIGAASTGNNVGVGAGYGAAGGAAIGTAIGWIQQDFRAGYADKYFAIDCAIIQSEHQAFIANIKIDFLKKNYKSRGYQIETLQNNARRGLDVMAKAKQLLSKIDSDISSNKKLINDIKIEIEVVRSNITQVETEITQGDNSRELIKRKNELKNKQEMLVVSLNNLNGIKEDLENQHKKTLSIG